MKKIITPIAYIFYVHILCAQINPTACSNDVFAYDSTKILLITEIKPFGPDRFVELWNCHEANYYPDMVYLSGMYSHVIDSFSNQEIPAQRFITMTLPYGLYSMDAIRVVTRSDTIWHEMYTVMYTLNDSSQSISMCDWYHETAPTPNESNACETSAVVELMNDSELMYQECFDILGILADCETRNKILIKKNYYRNGLFHMQKILH